MKRIFISYRNSDGRKDANRLAVDLNRVFGDNQVFLDKQDLKGGSSWHDEILVTLGSKPVVLALITPDYFGALVGTDRRIERPDDPVRDELLTALESGAQIVPLLVEGVNMPAVESLPEELRPLTSRHALKLHSEDWSYDLPRLVDDLIRFGFKVRDSEWRSTFGAPPQVRVMRWLSLAVAAFLVLLGLELIAINDGTFSSDDYLGATVVGLMPLGMCCYAWRMLKSATHSVRVSALVLTLLCSWQVLHFLARGVELNSGTSLTTAAAPASIDLNGVWNVEVVGQGPWLPFTITHDGINVKATTERFQAADHPSIKAMNKIAAATKGPIVTISRLKGAGALNGRELNLLMNMVTGTDEMAIGTATLTATVDESGRTMTGVYNMIGDRQALSIKLTRR